MISMVMVMILKFYESFLPDADDDDILTTDGFVEDRYQG